MRISRWKVSLLERYRPAQVSIGEKSIANVGEWKPGRKTKSLTFFIVGETSARGRTYDGEYGISLYRLEVAKLNHLL